jgi:hypothetical protein
MSVDLAAAVWEELKRYVSTLDRTEAADALVNLLIDSNFDADEIRNAFRSDSEIKKALNAYISDRSDDEEEADDEDADTDYDDEEEDY